MSVSLREPFQRFVDYINPPGSVVALEDEDWKTLSRILAELKTIRTR